MMTITGLTVARENRTLVGPLDLVLEGPRLTALVGPNGAGKTTLLQAMAGLISPATGNILLGATPLQASAGERQRIAWLPQSQGVNFAYPVRDVVMMGRYPWHQGFPRRQDHEAIDGVLGLLQLEGLADRPITNLSAGERQMALIGRALAGDQPILLLDEPLANLDEARRIHVLKCLKRLSKDKIILVALHELPLVPLFCDEVLALDKGRLVGKGVPQEILNPSLLASLFHLHAQAVSLPSGTGLAVYDTTF